MGAWIEIRSSRALRALVNRRPLRGCGLKLDEFPQGVVCDESPLLGAWVDQ